MQEESSSIIKDKELGISLDYDLLRKRAITMTQQISGDKWTDYNIHDPGVTIVEQFCYALTDISYRTNLNIETLLFHGGDRENVLKTNALYPPEEVFPTGPLTLSDYRILILDNFPTIVSNCWVSIVTDHHEGIQGLYQVTLLLKSEIPVSEYSAIKNDVQAFFSENRNLCEDIERIEILEPEQICISVDIDIHQDEMTEEVLAGILLDVEHYFNPSIHFSTLEELENKGAGLEEIFDIPSHKHGFIDRSQLSPKQQEFYVSKIADYILDVKGVRNVRNLSITQDSIPIYGDIIKVETGKYLTLGILGNRNEDSPFEGFNISVYKGGIVNSYLDEVVIYSLDLMEARTYRDYSVQTKLNKTKKDAVKTKELLSYESIQKSFPGIYGVGDYTPAQEHGDTRIAQSSQLKAYLMFFDQIMSNHLAQLSKISELFAVRDINIDNIHTYYSQLLTGTSEADELISKILPSETVIINRLSELEFLKVNLSENEQKERENLRQDLSDKKKLVRRIAGDEMIKLKKMSEKRLKANRTFENREIIRLLLDLKKKEQAIEQTEDSKTDEGSEEDKLFSKKSAVDRKEELAKSIDKIEHLMIKELMQKEQPCDFAQRDLDSLMLRFDTSYERKNRLMTHILARFGERFTTDFHIKFSSLMEGESQENIDKKIIAMKSVFLRQILNLNRFRSKGLNYRSTNSLGNTVPLKRKVSLLLNIEGGSNKKLASNEISKKLKSKKLTGADIIRGKRGSDEAEYIASDNKGSKAIFLINSSSYYRYLFKYGLKKTSYKVVDEDSDYAVYFTPPTDETSTRLLVVRSKMEAFEKIEKLIQHLKKINAKNEGFHIVEHILLRPLNNNLCYFFINGWSKNPLFKSTASDKEEIQQNSAKDTLLLAGYSNNYQILQSKDKEFVVIIKNAVGKELAKSVESFITEVGAQKFIDQSVNFFIEKKESDDFTSLYELDNQQKYYFYLMDAKNVPFLKSIKALDTKRQEIITEEIAILGMNPANYKLRKGSGDTYTVFLLNHEKTKSAQSYANFSNKEKASEFVGRSITYFEKLNAERNYKSIIRYQRVDGRSANEFNSQMSIVYPDWTARFHNQEFLQLFKQTLFNCAPAHLGINMVGLNYSEMKAFEKLYFPYMKEIANPSTDNYDKMLEVSNRILGMLINKN